MHRISDYKIGGISRRNFSMFRKLCGDETLGNVVIVTNMWGEVAPEIGAAREHELMTDDILFKPVIDQGARMLRHDRTLVSARAILHHIITNCPRALRIQKELVDEGKDIMQTAAGVELDRDIAALRENHLAQLAEIQQEMEEALAEKDLKTKRELEDERAKLFRTIKKIEDDRNRISKEYAEERARADARVREIQAALEAEKEERAERKQQIEQLMLELETHRNMMTAERERMMQELAALKELQSRRRGGFFFNIGNFIYSIFGWY